MAIALTPKIRQTRFPNTGACERALAAESSIYVVSPPTDGHLEGVVELKFAAPASRDPIEPAGSRDKTSALKTPKTLVKLWTAHTAGQRHGMRVPQNQCE